MNTQAPVNNSFHGEFSSSDASALNEAGSRFTLYKPGTTTPITLAATDVVVIRTVQATVGDTALTVQVYDGANATVDGGESIVNHAAAANSGIALPIFPGHVCQPGTYPKVKTSAAGAVKAIIHGTIQ